MTNYRDRLNAGEFNPKPSKSGAPSPKGTPAKPAPPGKASTRRQAKPNA